MAIPIEQWVWQGHAGHFIAASDCLFHMATAVGDFLISTVGDYHPSYKRSRNGLGERELIGGLSDHDFYETYVFRLTGKPMWCGCAEVESWGEIEGRRYATAPEATAGHMAMCHKYADVTPIMRHDSRLN